MFENIIAKLNELTAEVQQLVQEEETLKFVLKDARTVEIKGNGDVVEVGTQELLPDGEYEIEDKQVLIVKSGKFMGTKELSDEAKELSDEKLSAENVELADQPELETVTIDSDGTEQEYKVEKPVADRIKSLEATVEDLQNQIETLNKQIKVEPAKDTVEQSANKYNWISALRLK